MKLRPLFLSLLPLLPSLCQAQELTLPAKDKVQLFLLAGQSNMAGRGKADAASKATDPRIIAFNKNHEWQIAVDPLHWDKPAAGTGIGRPFAATVSEKFPGITIGLIPTACGGSPIATWQPGKHWGQTKSNPWDDSIAAAKIAMKDGTLKAILWHQGESDSNAENAPLYKERLVDLIQRFRKELGAPNLPFIIGQLGRFPSKPWDANREMVDAAQQAVAKEMKNVRFVPIENPSSIGDNLHFDTPTLRRFADGYAAAYFDITGQKP
jgi:hypothetical protein